MSFYSLQHLPFEVYIIELVSSRYGNGRRPVSWDDRSDGVDVVRTVDGKLIKLWSSGGQSPPAPGWRIIIAEGDVQRGFSWTLYGLPISPPSSSDGNI